MLLGSLVCFPNLYREIPLLQTAPGADHVVLGNEDIKVTPVTHTFQCASR